jgi:eukaryotic-like serine/threonine-protein kinase
MKPLGPGDPKEIGGIALRGLLGQGGMGTVYFGVLADGERVAVKVIRDDLTANSVARRRFDREILAVQMVQGPRVASLLAAAEPGEEPPWFAAEFIQGLTLAEYVQQRGLLSPDMGAVLGILLAEALASIHQVGLTHRDLKPSNIVLSEDGPRVIDFGLAALVDATDGITRTAEVLGTPAFMAPEQIGAARDVTSAADVYALGSVLALAQTGHNLYQRPTQQALLHAVADPATDPDLSGLPAVMTPLVGQMLAHDPASRPTLSEATVELSAILAAAGLSAQSAQLRLVALTYVERSSDPPVPDPPRRRRLAELAAPHVPSALVSQIADSLRRDYARDAQF